MKNISLGLILGDFDRRERVFLVDTLSPCHAFHSALFFSLFQLIIVALFYSHLRRVPHASNDRS